MVTTAKRLRDLLAHGETVQIPFTYDGFTARIAEQAGFDAVYMSGFGTAMSKGMPDVGLLTQTEMVENATYIVDAVSVPVLADADTGYGNAINVGRTVAAYERAGVAGIHIEDQVMPKRCGFFPGKQVIPLTEAAQKIRAAVDARSDPDFLIIARTDALVASGWDDVERRCRAFREAGADMVFVDGIHDAEELAIYGERLADVPRLYNGQLPLEAVQQLGFAIQLNRGPMFAIYAFVKAMLEELRETGEARSAARWGTEAELREAIANALGVQRIWALEQEYASAEG